MEHRNWNKNNIRTSLLGYGCMRFPTKADGTIDEERAEALLNTAKAAGVNYFDTAYPYHNGQSEPFVGRVIAKWDRSSFYLATKMPLWNCKSLDDAKRIFEEQLQRLGVDYIDFYLLHSLHKARYEKAKAMGLVDWLWQQKAAGRIRNFGFSCHDNSAGFEYILRDQPWDFCQLQYNYLDRDDRAEEISGDRGYQLTEECGVPLIIMEPIKGGTLASLPADAAAPLHALRPDASDASWGWTSRTISASGTSWACSARKMPSRPSGPPASRTAKRPCTVCAVVSAKPSARRSCPSVILWHNCKRSWTHCNSFRHRCAMPPPSKREALRPHL